MKRNSQSIERWGFRFQCEPDQKCSQNSLISAEFEVSVFTVPVFYGSQLSIDDLKEIICNPQMLSGLFIIITIRISTQPTLTLNDATQRYTNTYLFAPRPQHMS
jgi:hypothetical protein